MSSINAAPVTIKEPPNNNKKIVWDNTWQQIGKDKELEKFRVTLAFSYFFFKFPLQISSLEITDAQYVEMTFFPITFSPFGKIPFATRHCFCGRLMATKNQYSQTLNLPKLRSSNFKS